MTPEHVALFGFALVLVGAPLMSLALLAMTGRTRWFNRAFALVLITLWAPLACAAPAIIGQLA